MGSPQHLPLCPGDRICQGWQTRTVNRPRGLQKILLVQIMGMGQCLICNVNAWPDNLQWVRHIFGVLLRNNLLLIRRNWRSFINRWQNLRVRHLAIPYHITRDVVPQIICHLTPLIRRNDMHMEICGSLYNLVWRNRLHRYWRLRDVLHKPVLSFNSLRQVTGHLSLST